MLPLRLTRAPVDPVLHSRPRSPADRFGLRSHAGDGPRIEDAAQAVEEGKILGATADIVEHSPLKHYSLASQFLHQKAGFVRGPAAHFGGSRTK